MGNLPAWKRKIRSLLTLPRLLSMGNRISIHWLPWYTLAHIMLKEQWRGKPPLLSFQMIPLLSTRISRKNNGSGKSLER
jgi:hypothetical protein